MTRPIFPRSRRQADATTSTIGGEGDGTRWDPVVWHVAVGVVGAAALCLWYMTRARGDEGEGDGDWEQQRKLMAELEVRE